MFNSLLFWQCRIGAYSPHLHLLNSILGAVLRSLPVGGSGTLPDWLRAVCRALCGEDRLKMEKFEVNGGSRIRTKLLNSKPLNADYVTHQGIYQGIHDQVYKFGQCKIGLFKVALSLSLSLSLSLLVRRVF